MLCLERLLPGEIQALLQPARCPQHRSVEQRPGGACCVPIASVRHGLQLLNFNHLKPRVADQLQQLVQREVQHGVFVPLQRAAVQPQPAWSQGVSDRTHGILEVFLTIALQESELLFELLDLLVLLRKHPARATGECDKTIAKRSER